ncbi:MAG: hypothetical protein JF613_07365, partial [Acidobacteria bacterium]|nr:hypothetical protein [Acidobacteriota bacterium]
MFGAQLKRTATAVLAMLTILWAIPHPSLAQQHAEGALPHDFDEPIRLYTVGLGTFTRPISSKSAEAQAYFNQGFQLMYGFARAEAGRSFREAERRDPDCAICYWGEAWVWGPYISEGRTPEHEARAYAAAQKALALSGAHADTKEKAFITAMGARYTGKFDAARGVEADRAYARAMARVAETYPDDLDAATLYAEALFLLLPRPGTFDIRNPDVARVLQVLEAALKRDVHHPGACHLYVHTTELTSEPQRAEPCVEFLGNAIPGASHLNHMPAHTWTRVGRWGDAVRASLQAWQSDQKAAKGEAFLTYPAHDLQMLVYAASFDGQSAPAISAARGIAKLTGDPMYLTDMRRCAPATRRGRDSISIECRAQSPPHTRCSSFTPRRCCSAHWPRFSKEKSIARRETSRVPSWPLNEPSRSTTRSSSMTPSRCLSPRGIGSERRFSMRGDSQT